MRTAFHDLPASSFPFTIELLSVATGEVLWKRTVRSGPTTLTIPGRKELKEPVRVRVSFGDGTVIEQEET